MYSEYAAQASSAGQPTFSKERFRRAIDEVYEACRIQLDDVEIPALHQWLKDHDKFSKAFCGGDGSWNRERPASHGVYTIRTLEPKVRGGILTYHIMSTLDLECAYMGTSDSMEVFGGMVCFSFLANKEFGKEELIVVLDGDTKVCVHISIHAHVYVCRCVCL